MSKENLPQIKSDDEIINVLSASLYVGAQKDSIRMVLDYCRAAELDVMQKPVHIVPMYAATGKKDSKGKDIKAFRDVIMPGIGLYRIQASRSGGYAGMTEPEFGEEKTETIDGVTFSYPLYCKVTVKKRLSDGTIGEFSVCERWKENYATRDRQSLIPNEMWLRRPYGQIAKCAEAQALRRAFPDAVGSQPTAEEMEGKEIDITDYEFNENQNNIIKINEFITAEQAEEINKLCYDVGADITKFCAYMAVPDIDSMPSSKYQEAVDKLNAKAKKLINKGS